MEATWGIPGNWLLGHEGFVVFKAGFRQVRVGWTPFP